MKFIPDNIYHVYNQGNNRQLIFYERADYLIFIGMIRKMIFPFAQIISYSLMPNHFHFMLYADERCKKALKQGGLSIDPITNGIRKLLSGYARIFNTRYNHSGSVFRQKTKAKCLSEIDLGQTNVLHHQDYYVNCFHYIHQNPLKARLVNRMEEWEFSSFRDYAELRNGTLCNKDMAIKFCSFQKDTFLKDSYALIPQEIITQLF